MKCPVCGAPLKMEDKFCSYCGAPNTLAKKHQEDIERYEREFSRTQQEVLVKTRRAGRLSGALIVLFVMIVLNIAAAIVSSNTLNIRYGRRMQQVDRYAARHREAIEEMIREQDYISLRSYYYKNSLSNSDDFREYDAVLFYARHLGNVYEYFCHVDSYSYWKKNNKGRLSDAASDIISLYEDPQSNYYREDAVTEEKMKIILDIRAQAEAIFIAYGGFTEDEVQELPNMSRARVEKVLTDHLEKAESPKGGEAV